jgi:hypothetical protein
LHIFRAGASTLETTQLQTSTLENLSKKKRYLAWMPRGSLNMARFLVHWHTAGRPHFDLRLIQGDHVRSFSMLKEPPRRKGERRLAIEREALSVEEISRPRIGEEAFGFGKARVWDGGEATIAAATPTHLVVIFEGAKLVGRYELRRMRWYPGNRWLLEKSGPPNANLT